MVKNIHLVVNASEIGRQRGGNETYMAGLLAGLARSNPPIEISLLTCRWPNPASLPPAFRQVDVGIYRRFPFMLWQQTLALRRLQADWYLSTFFLPPVLPCRGAVFVHDLSFRAHPDYFPRTVAWYMRWLTGLAIRQADRVLTISEFSRQELGRFYGVKPEAVVIVPSAPGSEFRPAQTEAERLADRVVLARYGLTQPYILALGNIHPRKNLSRLLEAYQQLQQQRRAVPTMAWCGLPHWDSHQLLAQARTAGVCLTGFVNQDDLPALYRQALMLVYPSLYEGFGMPPVEAMACGTPVITSNTTSLPEVVGEAALTINPTNPTELAEAMARLIDDEALRQQLRQAGFVQAAQFTWAGSAQRLLAALA